ncbi:MAG: glycerol-3-phosphate 1-O-acyltransferase PlsY [Nitrospirae bacterium]|nr:glycerol-3-phosphate 1-O-acyltransferase PlsY [Nitrospirota bacterium]
MPGSVLAISPLLYLLVPVAFLMGSIPFGLIFTRSRGIDLRSTGSKNIGATNVLRSAGKLPAFLTLVGDMIKGAIPVLICKYIIDYIDVPVQTERVIAEDLWAGIVGLSAVLGHMFSVFLSFKGGKGVATGFGVLLVYSPMAAALGLIIWIAVAVISKISSLAAITAVGLMPVAFILTRASAIKVAIGIVLAALIIYKHKPNIKNLIAGTETRIGSKSRGNS